MSKLQRWSYNQTFTKLNLLAETEGFSIKQVNPAYTSQTCSSCGLFTTQALLKQL